jgi:hypothetical protein
MPCKCRRRRWEVWTQQNITLTLNQLINNTQYAIQQPMLVNVFLLQNRCLSKWSLKIHNQVTTLSSVELIQPHIAWILSFSRMDFLEWNFTWMTPSSWSHGSPSTWQCRGHFVLMYTLLVLAATLKRTKGITGDKAQTEAARTMLDTNMTSIRPSAGDPSEDRRFPPPYDWIFMRTWVFCIWRSQHELFAWWRQTCNEN